MTLYQSLSSAEFKFTFVFDMPLSGRPIDQINGCHMDKNMNFLERKSLLSFIINSFGQNKK